MFMFLIINGYAFLIASFWEIGIGRSITIAKPLYAEDGLAVCRLGSTTWR